MRILIVGNSDTGKRKLANDIQNAFPHLSITLPPEYGKNGAAVGALADPRMDLYLLSERVSKSLEDDVIYTHSLLDSLAHLSTRIVIRRSEDLDTFPWESLGLMAGWAIHASFKYDFVIFITNPDELSYYEQNIEAALDQTIKELGIIPDVKFSTTDSVPIDKIKLLILERINELSERPRDSEESSQRD